jgi:hypothetical protein
MKKLWILILILILGAVGFVYFSPMFEKIPPKIEVNSNGFTNLKEPVKISINDNSGVKYYNVTLIAEGNVKELIKNSGDLGKNININVKLPKVAAKEIKLIINAVDTSKWHFFAGNDAKKEIMEI